MATRSLQAIINAIIDLRYNTTVDGVVSVKIAKTGDPHISINFDNRKYIGRMELVWKGDHYDVYLTDKTTGKIKSSDEHASKSVYLRIETAADARKFVKWYILLTQLAALGRNRT